MLKNRTTRVIAGIVASFIGLAGAIVIVSEMGIIGFAMAKLMLVALLGLYVGFGILFAVYRFIDKLD